MGANVRRTLLLYVTTDMEEATREIKSYDGAVTIYLSNVVFVASMPSDFRAINLENSSTSPPLNKSALDDISNTMVSLWEDVVRNKRLLIPTVHRRISLPRRGLAAVAIVMPSHLRSSVFPLVLAGAHSLAEMYASEPINKRLSFVFEPYFITSPVGSPSSTDDQHINDIPSFVFQQSTQLVNKAISPSVVSFKGKLYCFYKRLEIFHKEFNGSSWSGEQQMQTSGVTWTSILIGPHSTIVFDNKLYCFTLIYRVLTDTSWQYSIWYNSFDGSNWTTFTLYNEKLYTPIGPMVIGLTVFNNKLHCLITDRNRQLWYDAMNSGLSWEGPKQLDETKAVAGPIAVVFNNSMYCFFQGVERHLMVTVVTPTGSQIKPRRVPNSKLMSQIPSAVVVGGKLYCFYPDMTGNLCSVVTSDGLEWRGYALLQELVTSSVSAIYFNNELYIFYQFAISEGNALAYIKLPLERLDASGAGGAGKVEWKLIAQGEEPSLEELNYSKGYKGFIQLATHMQIQHSANYGYVVYIADASSFPLLFDAYADDTRMCLQFSAEASRIHYSFAKMFSAQGVFDQRLVNSSSTYPPRLVSQEKPRYTLAWVSDWNSVLANASIIMVHRGHEFKPSKDTRLWVLFFDKRNSRWVEMEGPRISPARDDDDNGALACHFGPASKLYVFYHAGGSGGEMYYNVLKKVWDQEKMVHGTRGSNTPSPIRVGRYMHVFHSGPNESDEFRYISLDTEANYWTEDQVAYKSQGGGSPSTVQYMDGIFAFHKGLGECNAAKITHSLWNKDKLTWTKGSNDADSPHAIHGDLTAVAHGDFVYVFYVSDGDCIWWNQFDGTAWRGPTRVAMAYHGVKPMDGGVVACAWDDKIHCFFRGRDADTDSRMVFYKVFNTIDCTWNDELILPTASGFSSKPSVVHNQPPNGS